MIWTKSGRKNAMGKNGRQPNTGKRISVHRIIKVLETDQNIAFSDPDSEDE